MPDKPIIFGRTGSGKKASLVIPNLLAYGRCVVAIDPQGELLHQRGAAETPRPEADPYWETQAEQVLKSLADAMQASACEPPERA